MKNSCKITWKYLFVLIAVTLFIPSTGASSHPCLLFDDITETPGYQYSSQEPWSDYERQIRANAGVPLSRDFADPEWSSYNTVHGRAGFARDLAMAYQVTSDPKYAEKAREALLYMDLLSSGAPVYNGWALAGYCFAYDWTHPYLSTSDDEIIRDKLALLADKTYVGISTGNVNFVDQNGQVYPILGIAGITLSDYTNPNNLPLSSSPDDWLTVGTDYLFVSDAFHYDGASSLLSYGFDEESGFSHLGTYKNYPLDELMWWAQVYSHYYNTNIFDHYPALKRVLTSEVWESLPNHYSNNHCTNGNTKWRYHIGIANLLNDEWRSFALNHAEIVENSAVLPYSSALGTPPGAWLLYCVVGDYGDVPRVYPDWTSYLGDNYDFNVFRGSWNQDSDWLSLVTFDAITGSNRDSAHHDQLSIEYYSRGDLLLADVGENKGVLDKYYGSNPVNHNGITLEDPRTPFPVASITNSETRGIFKGNSAGAATPILSNTVFETSWMEMLDAKVEITKVVDDIKSSAYSVTLSSPIDYSRTILYPEKDYFIIIDRLEGSESWIYRNVFRPASLNINPSTDRDEASVGHVNGELWFGDISYDWLSLPYNVETATGIISNDFNWQTTNPYGNDILFHLYTAPASEIIVSKRVGRVGGYNVANEVFSPNIYFRSEPMENQYRVVALLSRYIDEEEKKAEEISVTGNGNAIKVISTEYIDYTYTGKGHSTFESIATDADTVYMRMMNSSDDLSLTMIGGTFVRDESGTFLQSSEEIGYLTLQQEEMKTQINLKICSGATIALRMYGFHVNEVLKDGVSFSYWSQDENSDVLIINSAQGEHTYEIHYTEDHPTPTVTGDLNNNGEVDIGDVMMVSYMVAGLIEEDLSADFNGNGYVDVGDAAKINRFFLGLVEEL